MSLIHNALREMERPPQHQTAAPLAPAVGRSPFTTAALAFTAVVIAGGALMAWWYVARQPATPVPAAPPLAPTPPAAQAPIPTEPPAVPGYSEAPKAEVVLPASQPPSGQTETSAVVASTPATSSNRRPRVRPSTVTKPVTTQAAEPSSEERFGLFMKALEQQDLPAAEEQLKALRGQLGRHSISLLRAEGWFAMAADNVVGARQAYSDILERLPGDEEASINMAALEIRQQRHEAARQILRDALRHHPESEELRAAIARFREPRRQ